MLEIEKRAEVPRATELPMWGAVGEWKKNRVRPTARNLQDGAAPRQGGEGEEAAGASIAGVFTGGFPECDRRGREKVRREEYKRETEEPERDEDLSLGS